MLKHLDKNGVELQVGDIVRYGLAEGKVLILEDWDKLGGPSPHYPRAGVYVSDIGYWGDCKAVAAAKVEKIS